MTILSLHLTDFRNLPAFSLAPLPVGCNILYGENGSGKTSLLEAIHTLGSGRSFRNHYSHPLIRFGQNKFIVFSHLVDGKNHQNVSIGIERDNNGRLNWRMNEEDVSAASQVASMFPMRVINAHAHDMIEQGPGFRRKFLDWGLFYQHTEFSACLRKFERTLKHRNALLYEIKTKRYVDRAQALQELAIWTGALIEQAEIVTTLRSKYVVLFIPHFLEIMQELLNIPQLHIQYDCVWPEDSEYASTLANTLETDLRLGHTQHGPHCADLHITIGDNAAKNILSRGQQKLLVCALLLSQGVLLRKTHNQAPIYLVDDLPSELDENNRKKILSLLLAQETQVFITAIKQESILSCIPNHSKSQVKMFHVKH